MALNLSNINFKNTNSLLRQMIPYLMQYKMGEVSNQRMLDRQTQVNAEEERLIRERMAEAESIAHRGREESHKYSTEEETAKFEQGITKLPYVNQLFMAYQKNPTPEIANKIKEVGTLYDTAYDNLQQGKPIPSGIMGKLMTIDPRSEIITNMISSFTTRAGSLQTAVTAAEGHKIEREKTDIERQKLAAEQAGGEKTTDYYKVMHNKINDEKKYLTSMKEFIESGADTATMIIDWKKVMGGPTTPQLLGQALSRLSKYDTKAMKIRLSPEEEAWLDKTWDIIELQKEKDSGGVGSSVLGDLSGQPTSTPTVPTTAQTTTDLFPSTTPAATPKAEQTIIGLVSIGEIRTSPKDGKQYRYLGNNKWTPIQ